MKIEFDEAKRSRTLEERGLDFAQAGEIFDGTEWTWPDDRQNYDEPRFITFGFLEGRLVALVWTERDGNCRIISMRKANEREQESYRRVMD